MNGVVGTRIGEFQLLPNRRREAFSQRQAGVLAEKLVKLTDHFIDRRPTEKLRFLALACLLEEFIVPIQYYLQASGKARF